MNVNSYSNIIQLPSIRFIEQTESYQWIQGTVFLCPLRALWITTPGDSDLGPDFMYMGDFSELFRGEESSTLCLRVWVHSQDCENWSERGAYWLQGSFPSYLPISYFLGKKEGDIIELPCTTRNKHFSITCEQLSSSFQRNSKSFEDMMEEMFMITYNNLLDKYQKGLLTEEEHTQWQIIYKMKQQHFFHSIITNRGNVSNCTIS